MKIESFKNYCENPTVMNQLNGSKPLEDLLFYARSELNILALAIPFFVGDSFFGARNLVSTIGECFDESEADQVPTVDMLNDTFEDLVEADVLERHTGEKFKGRTRNTHNAYRLKPYKGIYTSAALVALRFIDTYGYGVYPLLGSFYKGNGKSPNLLEWSKAMMMLKKARIVDEEKINNGRYLTIGDILGKYKMSDSALRRMLRHMEEEGYVRLVVHTSEVVRFSACAENSLGLSRSRFGDLILGYLQAHGLLPQDGQESGGPFHKHDLVDSIKGESNPESLSSYFTRLKRRGIYNVIYNGNHMEIQLTGKGLDLLSGLLCPMHVLSTKRFDGESKRVRRYFKGNDGSYRFRLPVRKAVLLYNESNPHPVRHL